MPSQTYRNALPPGYKLLWYRMEKVLGQGGFGITYLAWDGNLKIWVAIKEYLPFNLAVREADQMLYPVADERSAMYLWGLKKFLQEAQTLAQFSHKNIVQVYTVFEANNTAYMVMRYEEGESMAAKLRHDPSFRDEATLLRLIYPLLDGLAAVHAEDLIHRDIKPANIFIRKDNSPVLLDFGSARQVVGGQTQSLTTLVTPGYAPFEQYSNKGDKQGPWSDIYSLGATLYASITDQAPVEAVMRAQAVFGQKPDPLKPAIEVGKARFTPRFLKAIDKALCLWPADRPQTVAAWKTLFPQPVTKSRLRWNRLTVSGMVGALVMAGVSAVFTLMWWQGTNEKLPLLAEIPVTPSPHLPNERIEPPPLQPARAPKTDGGSVNKPEVSLTESVSSTDTITEKHANQQAMAGTKNGNQPIAKKIGQIGPLASTSQTTGQSSPKPLESSRAPPTLVPLQVQPAAKTVNISTCHTQLFSVIGHDAEAPYRWWLDGKPQAQTGASFSFSEETSGAHEIRVAAGPGQGSPAHRWEVIVSAPSVTQAEVEQWLAGVQHALERRDIPKLKKLGYVHTEPEASDLLEKLQARQNLRILLQNVRAELAADHAQLSFERVDQWDDPKSYSMVVDYSSHEVRLVRQGCASLVAVK